MRPSLFRPAVAATAVEIATAAADHSTRTLKYIKRLRNHPRISTGAMAYTPSSRAPSMMREASIGVATVKAVAKAAAEMGQVD